MYKAFLHAAIAGAGTGKTYSLVENYLSALFGFDESLVKKRPQEILALTFTEKAANEMRLRITKRLSALLLVRALDDPLVIMASEKNCEIPNSEEIRRILRALPNAHIATFHGFCAQFLRQESKAIKIDDRFLILSPKDETLLARNVLRPLIISELHHNAVVRSLVARFRLGANFSSLGLVDSLLQVYFKLSEKNIECEDLERRTQMNRVTQTDLDNDFLAIVKASDLFLNTKVSPTARKKLDAIIAIIDRMHSFKDQDETKIARLFKELKKEIAGNFGDKIARQNLINTIQKFASHLVDYFLLPDETAIARILARFHDEFLKTKRDALRLSYADLLTLTHRALRDNLPLRNIMKERIRHILVDEYQDTSPIQQDIIAMLSEDKSTNCFVKKGSSILDTMSFTNGSSLFIVGDQKQSIYGFRGANISLFSSMVKKMEETDGDGFNRNYLTINRRSSTRVIELVNLVASHTLNKQGYTGEHALIPKKFADDGISALWVLKDDANLSRTSANLKCASFGIVHLLSTRKDILAQDIVVLVRRIKSASIIKQQLSSFGVASRIVSGEGFFQQQEVVDLLSALKLMNDPEDQMASAVVFRSPLLLFRDQELFSIKNSSHGFNLLGALELLGSGQLSPSSSERLSRFSDALKEARHALKHDSLGKALDMLIDRCDFSMSLGFYDNAYQKWANVEKLKVMLTNMTKNPFVAIEDFYAQIASPGKEPLAESLNKADAITIMTIHQSKGLEWKVVVLADTESLRPQNSPDVMVDSSGIMLKPKGRAIEVCQKISLISDSVKSRYDASRKISETLEDEESARILYVALSRAKHELYVASSMAGFTSTKDEKNLLALFLRPYFCEPELFQKICGIEFKELPPTITHEQNVSTPKNTAVFQKKPGPIRLFASNLQISSSTKTKWQNLVIKQRASQSYPIDGALAHQLLARAGPAVFNGLTSLHHIEQFLHALVRSMTVSEEEHVSSTIHAVSISLIRLKESLEAPVQPIFEMALRTWPNARFLIEGFADVVLIRDDDVCVVEYKSSLHKIHDVNTYFQVLAYAHALRKQFERPVKYFVALFGSSQKITWQPYNDDVSCLFLNEFSDTSFKQNENIHQEDADPIELWHTPDVVSREISFF